MSVSWQELEEQCVNFLKDEYGDFFKLEGGSDSTKSDIFYEKEDTNFWIECKSPTSQAGQFVLIPDEENREFVFSKRNMTSVDEVETQTMIKHMSENFDTYVLAGTKGVELNLDEDILVNWVKKMYKHKGVKYIITMNIDGNVQQPIILPIDKLGDYFHVSATYRVKKSGSRRFTINQKADLEEALVTHKIQFKFMENLCIYSSDDLKDIKIQAKRYTYLLKGTNRADIYSIRVLSNTANANVIFSINLKSEQQRDDILNFEKELKI